MYVKHFDKNVNCGKNIIMKNKTHIETYIITLQEKDIPLLNALLTMP